MAATTMRLSLSRPAAAASRGGRVARRRRAAACDTTTTATTGAVKTVEAEVVEGPPPEPESEESNEGLFLGIMTSVLAATGFCLLNDDWLQDHAALAMTGVFVLGYAGIIFEETLEFNKSGVALLTAVSLWTLRAATAGEPHLAYEELEYHLSDVSSIIFFLIGAMSIVETVDAHGGFKLVTDNINTKKTKDLVWLIGGITFFMSAILDNLTSTIVMVSLLRKLISDKDQRLVLGAIIVIAANAGGAWTPIGDVTTTMLWINGQISTVATMRDLFLPSLVSLAVPLALASKAAEDMGDVEPPEGAGSMEMAPKGEVVFGAGVASLVFVPVFKTLTGLPPYLGMLLGLGAVWTLTDAIHAGQPDREQYKVPTALTKIDTQGTLFFLGILLSIASLESAGILKDLATWLGDNVPSLDLIATAIGLASAVIDNVPLVAATMGMYDMSAFPQDDELWQLIAYCAGTGGSILIIGSAAGVAFMGMEQAGFVWYTKRVSAWAASGYFAGIACYLVEHGGMALPALPALATMLPGN